MNLSRYARVLCLLLTVTTLTVVPKVYGQGAPSASDEGLRELFTKVQEHIQQQQFGLAIDELKAASQARNHQHLGCLMALSKIYMHTKDYRNAVDTLRLAIALKPANEAELHNMLGISLYQQSDKRLYEESAAAFQRALELSGGKQTKIHYSLGYALIRSGKEKEGVAALKKYLETNADAANAQEVRRVISNPKMAQEQMAPNFKVKSVTGEEISLEKYRGKIVLIDFWATWCPPCRQEMPAMRELANKYTGEQFVVIGINLDTDKGQMKKYLEAEKITWPQYYDGNGWNNKISRMYNVSSIPYTVLVDHNGVVRAADLRTDQLPDKIEELLKQLPK